MYHCHFESELRIKVQYSFPPQGHQSQFLSPTIIARPHRKKSPRIISYPHSLMIFGNSWLLSLSTLLHLYLLSVVDRSWQGVRGIFTAVGATLELIHLSIDQGRGMKKTIREVNERVRQTDRLVEKTDSFST